VSEGNSDTPSKADLSKTKTLMDLTAEVKAIRRLVTALDNRAATSFEIIEKLHQDAERLQSIDRHTLVHVFLTDLTRLRDDLLRQMGALANDASVGQFAELLESFAYTIERTLARAGVDILRPEVGSPVDTTRHRVAGVVLTTRAELDGTVAEVLSDGYLDTTTSRTLVSATVRAYRCVEKA